MIECYIGLGSNLKTPARQIRLATERFRRLPHSALLQISHLYFSRPMGDSSLPYYYNRVLKIQTRLNPKQLLSYCQYFEKRHERVHKKKWGSRTLDVDVLLYGNRMIKEPEYIVPHPGILTRDFVFMPLLDITPELILPDGTRLKDSLALSHAYIVKNKLIS